MQNLNQYDLKWCVRKLPYSLRTLIKKNEVAVAGGYIRSCIENGFINDIDLFIPEKECAEQLALSLVDGNEKKLIKTENAITVRG